jgi:hypothetical protein
MYPSKEEAVSAIVQLRQKLRTARQAIRASKAA